MSYDTENHCGYLISLDLAKSPLCEIHLSPRHKTLDLSPRLSQ